jgi:hypothetical protein
MNNVHTQHQIISGALWQNILVEKLTAFLVRYFEKLYEVCRTQPEVIYAKDKKASVNQSFKTWCIFTQNMGHQDIIAQIYSLIKVFEFDSEKQLIDLVEKVLKYQYQALCPQGININPSEINLPNFDISRFVGKCFELVSIEIAFKNPEWFDKNSNASSHDLLNKIQVAKSEVKKIIENRVFTGFLPISSFLGQSHLNTLFKVDASFSNPIKTNNNTWIESQTPEFPKNYSEVSNVVEPVQKKQKGKNPRKVVPEISKRLKKESEMIAYVKEDLPPPEALLSSMEIKNSAPKPKKPKIPEKVKPKPREIVPVSLPEEIQNTAYSFSSSVPEIEPTIENSESIIPEEEFEEDQAYLSLKNETLSKSQQTVSEINFSKVEDPRLIKSSLPTSFHQSIKQTSQKHTVVAENTTKAEQEEPTLIEKVLSQSIVFKEMMKKDQEKKFNDSKIKTSSIPEEKLDIGSLNPFLKPESLLKTPSVNSDFKPAFMSKKHRNFLTKTVFEQNHQKK